MHVYKSVSKNVICWDSTVTSFWLFSCRYDTVYRSFDFMNFFMHLGSSNFGERLPVGLKILLQVIVEIVQLQTTRVVNSFRRTNIVFLL